MTTSTVPVSGRLLLHDVSVQEGLGRASVADQSILIEGNRIQTVMPSSQAPVDDPDIEVLHLRGRTVMPGMTLGHSHIAYVDVMTARDTLFKYSLPELTLHAAHHAGQMLRLGYTGLVGAGSVAGIDMALKKMIGQGLVKGPRVTACSRDLMVSAPPDRRNPEVARRIPVDLMPVVDTAQEMVERTDKEIDEGAEIIKTFSSGDDTYPNAKSYELLYSRDELAAVVERAHARNVRVRAHSRGLDGIRNALAAGVDVVDHATYADEEALQTMAERGVFVVPSLYQPRQLLLHGQEHGKTPEYLEALDFQKEIDNTLWLLPRAVELGIPLVAGDDFGFAWTPHGTYAEELACYVEVAGIPAATVLTWATANGAALAGRGDDAGIIAPGRLADLVVTAGDPAQDIRVLCRPESIEMVLLDGRTAYAQSDRAVRTGR
jgi:imidazolonepropionase-like amidohydrolase